MSIKGCFFHYSQALWRKCQALGLVSGYLHNTTIHQVVRRMTTLPFAKKNIFPRYGHHAMLCLLNILCSKILWSIWILHGSELMPYSPEIYGPGIKLTALEQTTTWRGIIMPSREKQTWLTRIFIV
ncbi:uncharacterized protein LOC135926632 [Gordionus sp. m RMFG-2023]|uniref:uncharacterized protein LOC135926632 n=1 Tax=Gordionus sp. m RMFG-2023 TaxID=3053472 RepID=UPI0031FC7C88